MSAAFLPWLRPKLVCGKYFRRFAESQGRMVGGISMMVLD